MAEDGWNFFDKHMLVTSVPAAVVVLIVLGRCVYRMAKGGAVAVSTNPLLLRLLLLLGGRSAVPETF